MSVRLMSVRLGAKKFDRLLLQYSVPPAATGGVKRYSLSAASLP